VGIYEGAKKVLVAPDYSRNAISWWADRVVARIGGCPIRLYLVLGEGPFVRFNSPAALRAGKEFIIGLIASQTDLDVAREFFELFKTPWEHKVALTGREE
jgi:hypothetical protein